MLTGTLPSDHAIYTPDCIIPRDPAKLRLDVTGGSDEYSFCVMDEIFITKEVLSGGAIRRLANRSHALGFRRNYFSALMLSEPTFNPICHQGGDRYKFNLIAKEVLS